MSNMKRTFIIGSLLFLYNALIFTQHVKVVKDFRYRTTFGIEKVLFDNISLYTEMNLELEKDASQIGQLFGEIGVSYSPFKNISVGTNYRYTYDRKLFSDEFNTHYRFAINTDMKFKINRIKISYRLQYQRFDDDFNIYDENDPTSNIFRNRIKVKYNLPETRLNPYVYSELYIKAENGIVNVPMIKAALGGNYSMKKFGDIDIYLRIERELGSMVPFTYTLLGLCYYYKF